MDNINLDSNMEMGNLENRIAINKKENKTVYNFIKRTIDVLGSLCGLILLSPLLLVIKIVIDQF